MSLEDSARLEERKEAYAKEIRMVCETEGVDSGIAYAADLLAYSVHTIQHLLKERPTTVQKLPWWKRIFG
jgi:hypothetical protein